jgi:hypothetical protein
MVLIATPGATDANSYVTPGKATTYLAGRLHTEPWFALETEATGQDPASRNTAALLWATRLLDEQVGWYGLPTTTTQALAWPRTGVWDPAGRPLASTVIPVAIELATTLYALALLRDTSESSTAAASNVKMKALGDTRVEFFDPGTSTAVPMASQLPWEVRRVLVPYGRVSGGITVPLVRT